MSLSKKRRTGWMVAGLVAVLGIGGSLAACGSDEEVPPDNADAGNEAGTNEGTPEASTGLGDAGTSICADADTDADIDCTGKCGPVTDPCSGKTKQCGGCANAVAADGGDGGVQVCDLATNTCGAPLTTCTALGAECGTIKNSCGEYLDCPDGPTKGCAAGKECDPDTHKCRDCQAVTCKDLGYECGNVFLGCGEDIPQNYTDCGNCAPDGTGTPRKCNSLTNTCEPTCTPKSATELCNDAKAKRGVECGPISDGCGGRVYCEANVVPGFGCKAGEQCGVRGIGNRCDVKSTPDECKALGRNCGEITSACTGLKVKCGDCANGEVCNANGVCGAPCTPKTCTDYAQFQCGVFDDGCGSSVTCGCPNGGICNNATNMCCSAGSCNVTYAGKCGQDLPNGCGANILDCNCAGGTTCTADGGAAPAPATSTTGSCCTPRTAASYTSQGQCGTSLPNGCGANNITANCPTGQDCVNNANGQPGPAPPAGTVGSCCTRNTCPAAPACAAIPNNCRGTGTISCNAACTGGLTCNGTNCCQGAPLCAGNGGVGGECNTVKTPIDANCGSNRTCACTGGRICVCTNGGTHACTGADGAGVCTTKLSCSSTQYNNKCGVGLDDGVGGTLNCGCPSGKTCSTNTPGAIGACVCGNGLGAPYTCANVPNGPSTPGGDACGAFSDGCGGSLTCSCANGLACNTTANPNVCCTPAVCPSPGLGSACGTINNGCTSVPCGCPSGAGNENFACTNGTCQCVKDTCRGRTGPQPDRCGGTLQCGG